MNIAPMLASVVTGRWTGYRLAAAGGADYILSLGMNCEISYNIRDFYGIERAGLLDWFITPICQIPGLIQSGFSFVGPHFADELEKVFVNGGESIMHTPTGILMHHAFSRDAEDRIVENWRDEIPLVMEKHAFLGARMHETFQKSRRPLLFLNRIGNHTALAEEVNARCYTDTIYSDVIAAFCRQYRRAEPLFVITHPHPPSLAAIASNRRVVCAEVENHGDWHDNYPGHFAGCRTGWANAFSSLGISLVTEP